MLPLDSRAFIDLRLIAGFPALFVVLRDQASIFRVFYPGSSASSISRVFHAGATLLSSSSIRYSIGAIASLERSSLEFLYTFIWI